MLKLYSTIAVILMAAAPACSAQGDQSTIGDRAGVQVRRSGDPGPSMNFSEQAIDRALMSGPLSNRFTPDAPIKTKRGGIIVHLAKKLMIPRHKEVLVDASTFSGYAALRSPDITPHGPLGHPYHIEGRHKDGTLFYTFDGYNLRTSAGTTWQSQIMANTSTPTVNTQCNYMGLTNTGGTPAEADTTLSGEISSNGLSRAQGTYADASTTLAVPSAATASVIGTTGAVTYNYWVAACTQGICTSVSATSNQLTTANATLSTTNYNKIVFTGQNGASSYQVYRTTSGSAPSGTSSVLVGGSAACDSSLNCIVLDQSNSLSSVTIPASNLTNFGKFTLVHTWTATATQSAQAFGIFTASSSGTMCFEGTFTQVALNNGDTFQLTESVFF